MENKQIIIDGVDVSGCEYLYTDSKYNDKCCSASIGGNYLCKPSEMICIKYVECLKEQLKRKEQEYEELRKYHNKCCEEFKNEKQKLIDKYNKFSKDFFTGKYCKKEYCELLKAKEQECEELKAEVKKQKEIAKEYEQRWLNSYGV